MWGEIVVTQSEGMSDMQRLADGLMDRYERAQEPQPILLYTDRECCSQNGPSKYNVLFHKWTNLHVCLDIWHFMRRLANGCVSESHHTFMGQLSNCVFEWDIALLMDAKKSEMRQDGIANISDNAVKEGHRVRRIG